MRNNEIMEKATKKADKTASKTASKTATGTQEIVNPIILPPRGVFEDDGLYVGSASPQPERDANDLLCIGVEFPEKGGTLLHYNHYKYPKKGWPFKAALNANDTVKRFIMTCVRFVGSLPLNLLYGNVINSAVDGFVDFTSLVYRIHGVYWKPKFWCAMGREVWRVGTDMTDSERGIKFAKAICTLLEFDDAYRYYIQDGLGELNVAAFMKNPAKEARRVLLIMALRKEGTREKFKSVARLLPLLLYIPSVKRTAKEFFRRVDMEKLYLDEADWYICMGWGGYEFAGRSDMERARIRHSLDDEWEKQGCKHFDSEGNEIKYADESEPKNK